MDSDNQLIQKRRKLPATPLTTEYQSLPKGDNVTSIINKLGAITLLDIIKESSLSPDLTVSDIIKRLMQAEKEVIADSNKETKQWGGFDNNKENTYKNNNYNNSYQDRGNKWDNPKPSYNGGGGGFNNGGFNKDRGGSTWNKDQRGGTRDNFRDNRDNRDRNYNNRDNYKDNYKGRDNNNRDNNRDNYRDRDNKYNDKPKGKNDYQGNSWGTTETEKQEQPPTWFNPII